jgi:hypothetical protein
LVVVNALKKLNYCDSTFALLFLGLGCSSGSASGQDYYNIQNSSTLAVDFDDAGLCSFHVLYVCIDRTDRSR